MKLKISFHSNRPVSVPFGFTRYLQGLIYEFLDRISAQWLHENGFEYENRRFKLFTYSSFLERAAVDKRNKIFTFPCQVSFIISSPVDWLIEQVAKNIVISETVRIGSNNMAVSGLEIIPSEKIEKTRVRVNAVSPIEVHTTFEVDSGSKKTYFYSPSEPEFGQLINKNLQKKWASFYNEDCLYNISIEPVRLNLCKEQVRTFKDTVIKGYSGHYFIEGEPRFLEFGISCGLGSRNSGGFGMVEVV